MLSCLWLTFRANIRKLRYLLAAPDIQQNVRGNELLQTVLVYKVIFPATGAGGAEVLCIEDRKYNCPRVKPVEFSSMHSMKIHRPRGAEATGLHDVSAASRMGDAVGGTGEIFIGDQNHNFLLFGDGLYT